MLRAKAFVASGMLLLLVLFLSGCTAAPSAPVETMSTTEATVTETTVPQERPIITLALPFEYTNATKAVNNLNSLETAPYQLEVRVLDSYQEKLLNSFAVGDAPDLIWMDPYLLPTFAAQDFLVDITDRLPAEHDATKVDDYFPMLFQSFTHQGRQYGLPWRSDPVMLYVNTDHLAEAGLDSDVNNWTWETFLEACKQLTNNERYGLAVNKFWSVPIWSWQGGGDQNFYQTMSDVLLNNQDCTPKDEEVEAAGGIRTMMQENRVSMILDLASFPYEENGAIAAFILPKGPSNQDTSAAVTGLSINKQSTQPDIAYQAFLDLVWTVQQLEAYTPRSSLSDNTQEWREKLANQLKLDRSSDSINMNLHLVNVPVPHSIVWVPYPSPQPPIGDAELVPGAPPMIAGVNQLDAVLRAGHTRINVARTVRLTDSVGTSYLAPPDRDIDALRNRDLFEAQARNQGVIIGVAVIEGGTDIGIKPGAYALRVRLEGEKWMIDYIGAESTDPVFTAEVQPRDYSPSDVDTYPSAAILLGSKNGGICIPWLEWCFSDIPL